MENHNDLLRMISQALHENNVINEEILKLLRMQSGMNDVVLQEINRLLAINAQTLNFVKENTPTE